MNMENYNYWGDARVREGMINRGKVVEEKGRRYIVIEIHDDGDEECPGDIKVLCRWEVCDMCRGNGTHVNPSIDCGGLTREDFDRDPGFEEDYMSGVHDVTCSRCKGKRVEPVVDERGDPVMLKRYQDWMTEEYNSAAESAAERQMGA